MSADNTILRAKQQIRELRNAARALDGPGSTALIGPRFMACVAVLVREHLRQAEAGGRISVAAVELARQINQQAEANAQANGVPHARIGHVPTLRQPEYQRR